MFQISQKENAPNLHKNVAKETSLKGHEQKEREK